MRFLRADFKIEGSIPLKLPYIDHGAPDINGRL